MLGNPLSVMVFSFASWSFFDNRIRYEERILLEWFTDYEDYRKRTPTWIPMID